MNNIKVVYEKTTVADLLDWLDSRVNGRNIDLLKIAVGDELWNTPCYLDVSKENSKREFSFINHYYRQFTLVQGGSYHLIFYHEINGTMDENRDVHLFVYHFLNDYATFPFKEFATTIKNLTEKGTSFEDAVLVAHI